jgi:hypothetical protein
VLACAVALMAGQYAATGNVAYVWTALGVVFLDMLRYMDALEIYKVRSQMRTTLTEARREAETLEAAVRRAGGGDALPDAGAVGADLRSAEGALGADPEMEEQVVGDTERANADLQAGFYKRFPWYIRIRNVLLRGRIRPHLISGIEFQMGVFIVAPVIAAAVPGAIIPVVCVSAAGMLAFELFIIYKFWLSSRDYSRSLAKLNGKIEGYRAQLPAGEPEHSADAAVVGSSG